METKTLYIKNMACLRCQMAVKSELEKLGFRRTEINSGEVRIPRSISPSKREQLNIALKNSGFELMDQQKANLVKRIKNIIDDLVYYSDEQVKKNLPSYLSKKLKYDYDYLLSLFSEVYNTTIEKYFMTAKIEKAKELLVYYRLTLTEIAYQLNYNSTSHLINHFREVTGISPYKYQRIKYIRETAKENA